MADDVRGITGHQQSRTPRVTLHLENTLLVWDSAASTTAVSPTRRTFFRGRSPTDQRLATARSGLGSRKGPSRRRPDFLTVSRPDGKFRPPRERRLRKRNRCGISNGRCGSLLCSAWRTGDGHFLTAQHERFPFFAWDLFSSVPAADQTNFSARLISADGFTHPLPVYFEHAKLIPAGQEIQGVFVLQALGKAVTSGYHTRVESLRRTFETGYLGHLSNVHYEIVRRVYDIRVRSRCAASFTQQRSSRRTRPGDRRARGRPSKSR